MTLKEKTRDLIYRFVDDMSEKELDETLFYIQGLTGKITPKR